MNKYHNKKTAHEGMIFDSQKEARRWNELQLMQCAGMITEVQRQVEFVVVPKSEKFRASKYIADFVYRETRTGEIVIEDVKGMRKGAAYQVFKIKQKLMWQIYNYEVIEI
jgi:hypothetical protein